MGRVREFFRRNMSYPKGFGVKRYARSKRPARTRPSYYTRTFTVQDGADDTGGLPVTTGSTVATLMLGTTDFSSGSPSENMTRWGRLARFRVQWEMVPSESADTDYSIQVMLWLMLASSATITDWTTNNRSPKDTGIGNVAAANPFRILTPPKVVTAHYEQGADAQMWRAKTVLWVKRPVRVQFPMQLYLCKNVNVADNGAGTFTSVDVNQSYFFSAKMNRPNEV